MVFLSRIYTKTGDQGETGLGDGRRVSKNDPRVCAYGGVDELNCVLGIVVREIGPDAELRGLVAQIQNDLFDLGADLCVPQSLDESPGKKLRVRAEQASRLEKAIDKYNDKLEPLRSFVIPGGTALAAWCHLARAVCRRAERDVVALAKVEAINSQIVIYLNRLSDLLFVLGRVANDDGKQDVLWKPGGDDNQ